MFGTGYRVTTQPVVSPDEQTLYVGSGDEHIYALHTAKTNTHTQLDWDFFTPEGVVSTPAVSADGKAVFFGTGGGFGGNVYAINTTYGGGQLWKVTTGAVFTRPVVSNLQKTVFVGSYDKNLYAINAADGSLRWKFPTLAGVASSPVVNPDQKTVFVGSYDGNLYAVNAADGTLRWKFATGGGVLTSPAVSSDKKMVFVGCYKDLCAINAADGTLRWNFTTGDEVLSSPVLSSDNKGVFVGSDDGNLYAVNTADGTLRWKSAIGGRSTAAVGLDDKTLYYGSGDILHAVNTADGTLRWKFEIAGGVGSPAVSLDQKTVFFGTGGTGPNDGTVVAICTATGTRIAGPAHSPEKSIIDTGHFVNSTWVTPEHVLNTPRVNSATSMYV